jgi:hypothetical protein
MSSPTEEAPQVSESEKKKLDLEAAVKEKQEQDGESPTDFINNEMSSDRKPARDAQ